MKMELDDTELKASNATVQILLSRFERLDPVTALEAPRTLECSPQSFLGELAHSPLKNTPRKVIR